MLRHIIESSNSHLDALISAKKLTLAMSRHLKTHHKLVIGHSFYFNLLLNSNEPIFWNAISGMSSDFCRFLLEPDTIHLMKEKRISLNSACTTAYGFVLENKYGSRLTEMIIIGKAGLQELNQILPSVIKEIDKHPFLGRWLENGIVGISSMQTNTIDEIVCQVYAKRLFGLYKGQSYIVDNQKDTLEILQAELKIIANYHKQSLDQLKEMLIKKFVLLLKADFSKQIHRLYAECGKQILKAENLEKNSKTLIKNLWQNVLETIITTISSIMPKSTFLGSTCWSAPLSRKKQVFESLFGNKIRKRWVDDLHSTGTTLSEVLIIITDIVKKPLIKVP